MSFLLPKKSRILIRNVVRILGISAPAVPSESDLSEARRFLHDGLHQRALVQYQEAISKNRRSMEAYLGTCICLFHLGQWNETLDTIQQFEQAGLKDKALNDFRLRCLLKLRRSHEIDEMAFREWRTESDLAKRDYYDVCREIAEHFFSKERVQTSYLDLLLQDLLYQPDDSLPVGIPSVLCAVSFHFWSNDKEAFVSLMAAVGHLLEKERIDYSRQKGTGAFFLTFGNFIDPETRKQILAKFFLQFDVHAHWAFILIHSQSRGALSGEVHRGVEDAFSNINIAREMFNTIRVAQATSDSAAMFTLLQLAAVCNPAAREQVVDAISRCNADEIADEKNYRNDFDYIVAQHRRTMQAPYIAKQALRIAVCISGQLRGYCNVFPSWSSWGLDRHSTSFFVHTWKRTGISRPTQKNAAEMLSPELARVYCDVIDALGNEEMALNYPNLLALWEMNAQADESSVKEFYGAEEVVVDDDTSLPFRDFSNARKMYYKIRKCHDLTKGHGDFDLVIRVRPDFYFGQRRIDFQDIYAETISGKKLFVSYQPGYYFFPTIGLAMGDVFAIGSPMAMDGYAAADAMTMGEGEYAALQHFPKEHIAHGNAAFASFYNGLDLAPLSFQALDPQHNRSELVRSYQPASSLISEALKLDASGRMNKWDIALLAAC
jgi:hypothetical protein